MSHLQSRLNELISQVGALPDGDSNRADFQFALDAVRGVLQAMFLYDSGRGGSALSNMVTLSSALAIAQRTGMKSNLVNSSVLSQWSSQPNEFLTQRQTGAVDAWLEETMDAVASRLHVAEDTDDDQKHVDAQGDSYFDQFNAEAVDDDVDPNVPVDQFEEEDHHNDDVPDAEPADQFEEEDHHDDAANPDVPSHELEDDLEEDPQGSAPDDQFETDEGLQDEEFKDEGADDGDTGVVLQVEMPLIWQHAQTGRWSFALFRDAPDSVYDGMDGLYESFGTQAEAQNALQVLEGAPVYLEQAMRAWELHNAKNVCGNQQGVEDFTIVDAQHTTHRFLVSFSTFGAKQLGAYPIYSQVIQANNVPPAQWEQMTSQLRDAVVNLFNQKVGSFQGGKQVARGFLWCKELNSPTIGMAYAVFRIDPDANQSELGDQLFDSM
jgi:hypothetical protein